MADGNHNKSSEDKEDRLEKVGDIIDREVQKRNPASPAEMNEIVHYAMLEVFGDKAVTSKAYFEAKEQRKQWQEAQKNNQTDIS